MPHGFKLEVHSSSESPSESPIDSPVIRRLTVKFITHTLMVMKAITRFLPLLFVLLLGIGASSSCVNVRSERGVENLWSSDEGDNKASHWSKGKTTKSQILKDLGPPSQVLSLGDETVFYYLREQINGQGIVFIVYNNVKVHAEYDRAIFFFDKQGVLTDFSVSEG